MRLGPVRQVPLLKEKCNTIPMDFETHFFPLKRGEMGIREFHYPHGAFPQLPLRQGKAVPLRGREWEMLCCGI
jgi:hypothetical protein